MNNEPIPVRYNGDGQNISPALTWSGVPGGAKESALVIDDPDAPTVQSWVHWVEYGIPADVVSFPPGDSRTEAVSDPAGALRGNNSSDTIAN